MLLALLGELAVEAPAGFGFAGGPLGRYVLSLEGGEDFAGVGQLHGGDVFEEGDKGHQVLVLGVAGPFGKDDGVFGLRGGVGRYGVESDDFGGIAVQEGDVLEGLLAMTMEKGRRRWV